MPVPAWADRVLRAGRDVHPQCGVPLLNHAPCPPATSSKRPTLTHTQALPLPRHQHGQHTHTQQAGVLACHPTNPNRMSSRINTALL
mmetsp:Transcript_5064/g.12647  ORF Transcript_5064/g.12647 Transcript_5064/m.12647 type:complete len:87 (-) Transcript_5064:7-267(-)